MNFSFFHAIVLFSIHLLHFQNYWFLKLMLNCLIAKFCVVITHRVREKGLNFIITLEYSSILLQTLHLFSLPTIILNLYLPNYPISTTIIITLIIISVDSAIKYFFCCCWTSVLINSISIWLSWKHLLANFYYLNKITLSPKFLLKFFTPFYYFYIKSKNTLNFHFIFILYLFIWLIHFNFTVLYLNLNFQGKFYLRFWISLIMLKHHLTMFNLDLVLKVSLFYWHNYYINLIIVSSLL